jgi:hypothetical protein
MHSVGARVQPSTWSAHVRFVEPPSVTRPPDAASGLAHVLVLEPPVPTTVAVAQALQQAIVSPSSGVGNGAPAPTWHALVVGADLRHARVSVFSAHGDAMPLPLMVHAPPLAPHASPGCLVARVPFSHAAHLRPLLGLLRQQLVFNELYASCFRGAHTTLDAHPATPSVDAVLVEVAARAPSELALTVARPRPIEEAHAAVVVRVQIAPDGATTVRVLPPDAPGASAVEPQLQQALRLSLSVPVLVWTLVRCGAATEPIAVPVPASGGSGRTAAAGRKRGRGHGGSTDQS